MFVQAALHGKNGFFRVTVFLLLIFAGIMIGQIPLIYFVNGGDVLTSTSPINQVFTLMLILLAFVGGMLVLVAAYYPVHRRSVLSLIAPDLQIDWRRIFNGFLIWMLLLFVAEVILYLMDPGNYQLQFDRTSFALLLLVSLLMIPIQTSLEELVFRGYLLQQFSLLFNSRVAGLALSAVLFGLMHMANPEVQAFGLGKMLLYYIAFGLFAGFCTLADGRLELVLGVHAATNLYGSLFVTFESSAIRTPALFKLVELDLYSMMAIFVGSSLLFLLWASRRYQWQSRNAPFRDKIK